MQLRFLLLLFVASSAFADYGLIPYYETLRIRTGFDYYRTSQNFMDDGTRQNLTYVRLPTQLTSAIFSLEPEYGIAQDWSIYARGKFLISNVNSTSSNTNVLSNSGLGDTYMGVKWNGNASPLITPEFYVKIPTGQSTQSATTDVVLGDGNVDIGFKVHIGDSTEDGFTFFGSPGFVFRSGGYSMAATLDLMGQYQYSVTYFQIFGGSILSFSPTALYDSSTQVHNALGTGGSYALLNGSPTGSFAGAKVGFVFYQDWAFEGGASFSFLGNRYPQYVNVSFGLILNFDLFNPPPRKKVHEVPFDTPQPLPEAH